MNKLTVNDICIQGSAKNGKRIIAAFEKLGVKNENNITCSNEEFYYLHYPSSIYCSPQQNRKIITIEQLEEMAGITTEKTFPRMMWVWDIDEKHAEKMEVLADLSAFGITFLPIIVRDNSCSTATIKCGHAKEIEETPVKEMTIEQISKELGYEIKIIKS